MGKRKKTIKDVKRAQSRRRALKKVIRMRVVSRVINSLALQACLAYRMIASTEKRKGREKKRKNPQAENRKC